MQGVRAQVHRPVMHLVAGGVGLLPSLRGPSGPAVRALPSRDDAGGPSQELQRVVQVSGLASARSAPALSAITARDFTPRSIPTAASGRATRWMSRAVSEGDEPYRTVADRIPGCPGLRTALQLAHRFVKAVRAQPG